MNEPDDPSLREVERLRRQILEAREDADLLRREVLRLQRTLAGERRYFDLVHSDIEALFGSLTWRLGAGAAEALRRLMLQSRKPLVRDHLESVIRAALDARKGDVSPRGVAHTSRLTALLAEDSRALQGPLLGVKVPSTAPPRVAAIVARRGDFSPSGSAHIRVLEPMNVLAGMSAVEFSLIETPGEVQLGFDCVIVQRNALPRLELVKEIRAMCSLTGSALIFEIDDDLFADDFDAADGYAGEELEAMRTMAKVADGIVCSTSRLAGRLKTFNENIVVIDNALSEALWVAKATPEPAPPDPTRILYMGTRTHAADLKIFEPAWKRLKSRYGDAVALDRIGVVAERARAIGTPVAVPGSDPQRDSYPQFARWLRDNNVWHIGIAPLVDTAFNQAKSAIKYMDYAALGLPTVASDVGAYRTTIRHGDNGLRVANRPDDWFEAVAKLIENPDERAAMGRRAREDLLAHHTLSARVGGWLHLFEAARARRRCEALLEVLDIDDDAYRRQHSDVADGIRQGLFSSAQEHWRAIGRHEVLDGARCYHARWAEAGPGTRSLTTREQEAFASQIEEWSDPPLISVIMPTYKPERAWLEAAVDSVARQAYPNWELCICDDASGDADLTVYLSSLDDPRIKVTQLDENAGIAGASNAALALARGSHIALLDHDDELSPDALAQVAAVIVDRDPDLIYSDEVKLAPDGSVTDPHYKPDFSREQVQSQNYVSHLTVLRRSIVESVGGFRTGVEGSQDHDLLLRACCVAETVHHIPQVLYYWRQVEGSTASAFDEKSYAWDAGVAALAAIAPPGDVERTVEKGLYPGTYRVKRRIEGKPKVSIIVPFRDEPELLGQCVESIFKHTQYDNFEVVGIDNQSALDDTASVMQRLAADDERVWFQRYDRPFNFSAINNYAVRQAAGDHVLLLNNDIVIDTDGWLEAMLEYSQLPDIGAVGALLLYPDRTIQHAGVILGIGGVAGHSHKYLPFDHHGYFSRPHIVQNVSAVTGACLMVKRSLYLSAGGLNESALGVAFNDVDFCLRLRERGYENVYTPYARAIHHESKSRGQEDTPEKQSRFRSETLYMLQRHAAALVRGDPFFSPNLSLTHEDFRARYE